MYQWTISGSSGHHTRAEHGSGRLHETTVRRVREPSVVSVFTQPAPSEPTVAGRQTTARRSVRAEGGGDRAEGHVGETQQ